MDTHIVSVCFILCLCCAVPDIRADTLLGCDPGWVPANGNCYLFVNNKMVTWKQARDECEHQSASLMRLYNQTEMFWYKGYISTYPSSGYWTALNDIPFNGASVLGTGTWKWGNYEYADMSFIVWNQSPANDLQSNCAGVNIQGKLADWDCTSRQGFICELPGTSCPIGWLNTPSNCYWVSDTTDPSKLYNFQDAQNYCKQMSAGSTLMVIDDAEDKTFLFGQLPYTAKTTKLHWVGLQFSTSSGQWSWINGAALQNNLVSWETEPDNVDGVENCGVIRMSGTFSDRNCDSTNNYICKKPQDVSSDDWNVGCGLWLRAGHMCYEFYSDPKSTWSDALATCRSMQGDLLNAKSLDEKQWIRQQMFDPGDNHFYWSGLNDRVTEGTYVWADKTLIDQNYVTWNQEPNDYFGTEDCAVIYNTGQYNDVSCLTKAATICELNGTTICPSAMWKQRPADNGNGINCYLFTSYTDNTNLFMFSEALNYCKSFAQSKTLVPTLLSVNTPEEKTFILNMVRSFSDNVHGWYTGLNDQLSEGYWAFMGSYQEVDPSLIDWRGQPANITGNEDCGMLVFAGKYHLVPCSRKLGFVCQRPAYEAWNSGAVPQTGSPGILGYLMAAVGIFVNMIIVH